MAVSPKQDAFIREFLIDRNGTKAAIRAGYSAATAPEQASRLLRNVKVAEELAKLTAAHAEEAGISVDRTLAEIARIAYYNPERVFRVDPDSGLPLIDFSNATDEDWRVVAEVSVETVPGREDQPTVTKAKVKHQCKLVALEKLMRYHGLYTDKVDVSVISLTDTERMERLAAIADAARTRGARQTP